MSSTTVGVAPVTPAAGAGPRPAAGWNPAAVVTVAMALVAVGLQVLRLTRPGVILAGGSYDTTLYLGSAIRLVHGALPYRDFALLQPPGLVLTMSPFALVSLLTGSRGGLIVLSLCTPVLAGANVLLLGRLVAHRGWRAALTACALLAVYPAMYEALLDGLLEPLMCLFCLLGAVLVFDGDGFAGRWRIIAGGVAFGFAVSILVAAVVPALVMAALWVKHPRARLLPYAGGAVVGFMAPVLPFLALAPGSLVHDTVVTQLLRVRGVTRTPLATRLQEMTFAIPHGSVIEALAAVLMVAAVVVGALIWARSRLGPLEWFAIGATVVLGAAQFVIATYYAHFPAMLLPYPAILLGFAMARLTRRRWRRLVPAVAVLAFIAAVVGLTFRFASMSSVDYGPIVDAVIPANGCSMAENTQVLVQSDRFESTVPDCTTLVDPYSTYLVYARSPGGPLPADRLALEHTDYLVVSSNLKHFLGGPLRPLDGYVTQHFRPHHSGRLTIYVRDGFPVE